MSNVIICGGCGKMASQIARKVYDEESLKLAGIIESPNHPSIGQDWGMATGMGKKNIKIETELENIINKGEVVVDFTNPEATMEHLEICSKNKKAMVIGTTGLNESQVLEVEKESNIIPILFSPNMALGVNLLFELVKKVAGILNEQYDVEIIETHHHYKKDAPSGTAKKIAETIAHERNVNLADNVVYGRSGNVGERKRGEIGIHAVRAGNISGEHTIIFDSAGERLELTHKAYSREAFAEGTIKAIHYILQQKNGLFSMREVLNL
jgi:4-hydroxy-tetrahydrodipicolinate reductase